ncbi:MAG: EAL domain-containing protein [Xanthomonadales bacterium]|nr:EAL domain-containing protein [Xanthomonadales bacterium]
MNAATQRLWRQQLAGRIARVRERAARLQREGWDINTLHRQAEELELLASACRDLDAMELADALAALHAATAALLAPPRLPQQTETAHLAALDARLGDIALPPPADADGDPDMEGPDRPDHESGFAGPPGPAEALAGHGARAGADATSPAPPASLAEQIRDALAANRLQLVFQPLLALRGDAEGQFQALLRMRDAHGQLRAAAELLPVATDAGLLAAVDRWVLEHCVMLLARHKAEHGVERLFASQALSSVSDPAVIARLGRWLAEWHVDPAALAVEIRLDEVAAEPVDGLRLAELLQELGVGLVLSGYQPGTPAASMLERLPARFAKLDGRLAGTAAAAELRDHVDTLRERGMEVIAPRVENARGAAFWHGVGVDFIQGNFVQAAASELAFEFTEATL